MRFRAFLALSSGVVLAGCQLVAGLSERSLGEAGTSAGGTGAQSAGTSSGGTESGADTGGSGGSVAGSQSTAGTENMTVPGEPSLGAACDGATQLACNGRQSRQQLLCDPTLKKWIGNGLCPSGEFCDSAEKSKTQGTCLPVVPECIGHQPGDHVCKVSELHACGGDGVTTDLIDNCQPPLGECARCRPVSLATIPGGIALTQYDTFLYVLASGGIFQIPSLGGAAVPVAAPGPNATGLAADEATVYWADPGNGVPGAVRSVPIAGGPVTDLAKLGVNIKENARVAVFASNVFFNDDSGLFQMSVAGKGSAPAVFSASGAKARAILLDVSNVYWVTEKMALMKKGIGASTTEVTLAPTVASPQIAVDRDWVYFYRGGAPNYELARVPTKGNGAAQVVDGLTLTDPLGPLASDGENLYFGNGNALMRVSTTAGGGASKVVDKVSPKAIVVNQDGVYWLSSTVEDLMVIGK